MDKDGGDTIRQVFLDNTWNYKKCYENYGDGKTYKFKLNFDITIDGTTDNVKTIGPMPRKMEECMIRMVKTTKFPKLKKAKTIEISQPINFHPAQ